MAAIITTNDGSHTVINDAGLAYHSRHGAIQESQHVFIGEGLKPVLEAFTTAQVIHVFEVGFGTGLNALLTAIEGRCSKREIAYDAVETHPLNAAALGQLNYGMMLNEAPRFREITDAAWNEQVQLSPGFELRKTTADITRYQPEPACYHLVYFDAFAPEEQPELWTPEIFSKLYDAMCDGAILTTYCAKGQVRRNMMAAGFRVQRIPGPPGKRQMMRARK